MAKYLYVIEHAEPETLGVIALGLDSVGIEPRYIRSYAGEPVPSNMDRASGLVVMGGPMGVHQQEEYPFLTSEIRLIKQAISLGKPVLGICLGSQLLAVALGAKVRTAPRKEIGWHAVSLTADAENDRLFTHVEPSFVALHWHGDIFELPSGATSLAASAQTQHQAFRYGTNVYGLLFHLEVTEQIVEAMARTFSEELQDLGIAEEQILEGIEEYLPRTESMGEMVFSRWAALTTSD